MINSLDYKGIILAGGSGSRLFPLTLSVSKQLMPVYDKPMIYYPLSTLMFAGIRDILIITTPSDQSAFQRLLKDGSQLGLNLNYAVQPQPQGLAQAFEIGATFIGSEPVCLILGDNIFYGDGLPDRLQSATLKSTGATVFAYYVKDPTRYGVLGFDDNLRVTSIEEKPKLPRSNFAVTGLYFFDNGVVSLAKNVRPSPRGELEITDLVSAYMQQQLLSVELLGRGYSWLDAGTHESLLDAANFMRMIEDRQGLKVCCPEEVAYRMGYIDAVQLERLANAAKSNSYGQYLFNILNANNLMTGAGHRPAKKHGSR